MNKYTKIISLSMLVLSALELQAYTFSLVNHTNEKHKIEMLLNFTGETWQNLGIAEPGKTVSYNFGGWRGGMCFAGIAVDGKEAQIWRVGSRNVFDTFMSLKNNPRKCAEFATKQIACGGVKTCDIVPHKLDPGLGALGFMMVCGDKQFELLPVLHNGVCFIIYPAF